jgi:diacylglycerol kinase family enzyme
MKYAELVNESPARIVAHDAPFFVIMNAGSGDTDKSTTREVIERALREGKRDFRIVLIQDPSELARVAQGVVREAQAANGVVVVGGGDGTINSVANAVYGSGCSFAVVPQGTFNYFGRTHGIPEDPVQAASLLLTARAHPVQVGMVNDRLFLVNASLGLYSKILEDREVFKKVLGRSRWVGFIAAIRTIFRDLRALRLDIHYDGGTRSLRTRTLFVGNNLLQLETVGIKDASALNAGQLVGIVLRPLSTPKLVWLLAYGALGNLGDADQVVSFALDRLTVAPRTGNRRMKVGTDGEIVWLRPPIEFKVAPEPLYLLKPEPGSEVTQRS